MCGEKIGNIFCSFESWQPGSLINFIFSGKRWVECQKKQQISIPDNIDPETQVINRCITSLYRDIVFILLATTFHNTQLMFTEREGMCHLKKIFIKLIVVSSFNNLKCKIPKIATTLAGRKFASKTVQLC